MCPFLIRPISLLILVVADPYHPPGTLRTTAREAKVISFHSASDNKILVPRPLMAIFQTKALARYVSTTFRQGPRLEMRPSTALSLDQCLLGCSSTAVIEDLIVNFMSLTGPLESFRLIL